MKCPLCGKEFTPYYEKERFCSFECHKAATLFRDRKLGKHRLRDTDVPLDVWIIRQKEDNQ